MSRSEKALERWAVRQAKQRGYFVVKLALLQGGGWPDLTLFRDGRVAFLELKKDEKSRFQPLEQYYLDLLTKMGFQASVAWSKEQVEDFLDALEIQTVAVSGSGDSGDGE